MENCVCRSLGRSGGVVRSQITSAERAFFSRQKRAVAISVPAVRVRLYV